MRKTFYKQGDTKRRERAHRAVYCFHCAALLHTDREHLGACREHESLLEGLMTEDGVDYILDPPKKHKRICRDCSGTLPPTRYFRCNYCMEPGAVMDMGEMYDEASDWE